MNGKDPRLVQIEVKLNLVFEVKKFRYAITTFCLSIPVIVVVVGTGYEWERSEVSRSFTNQAYECSGSIQNSRYFHEISVHVEVIVIQEYECSR